MPRSRRMNAPDQLSDFLESAIDGFLAARIFHSGLQGERVS